MTIMTSVPQWFVWLGAFLPPAQDAPRQEPPTVDMCTLVERPLEFRGRIVRVSAKFMQAVAWKECDEGSSRARLCIAYGEDPSKKTSSPERSNTREVVAIAETSPLELSGATGERLDSLLDALEWTPLEYQPAELKKDEFWQQFVDARSTPGSIWNVTLEGRFEHVNGPSFIRYSDGSETYVTGYGLRATACDSRLVITEVLSVEEAEP